MRCGGDIDDAICSRGRGADRVAKIKRAQNFLLFAGGEHEELTFACAQVDFVVCEHWRAPYFALNVVCPMRMACRDVQAMNLPPAVRNEQEVVFDRGRR